MLATFSVEEYWKEILNEISKTVSAVAMDLWIKKLKPVEAKGDTLVLETSNYKTKEAVIKNFQGNICAALSKTNLGLFKIDIQVQNETSSNTSPKEQKIESIKNEVFSEPLSSFNPKYTFETFVVGGSNSFAVAAAKAVAENPGGKYNPLFIYGGVGLGKTHLLHSIGNQLVKTKPKLKVMYVTTEKFLNELIESIQPTNKDFSKSEFRQKYRSVDVLIIDDIQYIIGKTSTQEEFFHTFNELIQNNKQIVISADKPPKEFNPLEDRLRSRFEWGLLADIGFPDIETRIAILKNKSQIERYNVEPEVLEYIAEAVKTNIREMEGHLSRAVFYAGLLGKTNVTLEIAKEALKSLISTESESDTPDADKIFEAVSKYFNITKQAILSKKRLNQIVKARQICMYLLCEYLKSSPLSYIGELFSKDHSTVIYARDKIGNEIKKNKVLKTQIQDIKNLIKGL